ncbi:MAG: RNA polymerase sigma factor [Deltaproteobacteria bacterium]|nr:RNA polymerase sigma factor [Deltaproteobacteria bacterium]
MTARPLKLHLVPQAPEPTPDGDWAPDSEITEVRGDGKEDEATALESLSDESLVPLVVQGHMGATEQLYRRHAAFAFNLGVRIAGSATDIEDVVHDAFLRAFENITNLRNPKAFRSWLGSIVVHATRSRLRRGKLLRLFGLGRGGDVVDIDCIASDQASPRARAELAQVYALLQTLPADDRIAWTLRCVEGHDLKAAAELAGCSLATIKRRIRRTQRYLANHFVAAHDEGDETNGEFES